MKKYYFISFILSAFCFSCIEKVELPYRNESPILVIDGGITNEAPPYTIKLSYSGKFVAGNIITSNLAVNGARVYLVDDLGDSTRFIQNIYVPSLYQTDLFYKCKIGRQYALHVEMPDGKKYQTTPQLMRPVPPIDSIYADKTSNFVRFYIDTKDPATTTDYYKWDGHSISLKITSSGTTGTTCNFSCWAYNNSASANIMADTYINGKKIVDRIVFYSPITLSVPLSKHYIEVRQKAISKEAYLFWLQYQEQKTRTGSIFDPLPSTIVGNLVNTKDSKDYALGFFEVASVSSKKLIADPANLTLSTIQNPDLPAPLIESFKSNADCQVTYPFYGCSQPTIWQFNPITNK